MNEMLLEAMGGVDPELVRAARTMGGRRRRSAGRRVITVLLAAALMLALATTAFAWLSGADWFKSWFAQTSETELTPGQEEYIQGATVDVGQSVTKDSCTITLQSAIASRNQAYIRLAIALPEGVELLGDGNHTQNSLSFDDVSLETTGPEEPYGEVMRYGMAQSWRVEDDGKYDLDGEGRITLILECHMDTIPGSEVAFTDGYVRTLTLSNFRRTDLSAEPPFEGDNQIWDPEEWSWPEEMLAEGEWTFSFTFVPADEEIELITQPIPCQGQRSAWRMDDEGNVEMIDDFVDIEMTSFRITALGATYEYDHSEYEALDFWDVYVVMKDGTSVPANMQSGSAHAEGGGSGSFEFPAPIVLEDVDHIQLPNGYTIPMRSLTN